MTARETAQESAREIKVLLHLIGQTVEARTRQMDESDRLVAGDLGRVLVDLREIATFLRCKPQK